MAISNQFNEIYGEIPYETKLANHCADDEHAVYEIKNARTPFSLRGVFFAITWLSSEKKYMDNKLVAKGRLRAQFRVCTRI